MLCFYLYKLDTLSVQLEIRNVSVLKLAGDLCDYDFMFIVIYASDCPVIHPSKFRTLIRRVNKIAKCEY
jgi:hypothetical protein